LGYFKGQGLFACWLSALRDEPQAREVMLFDPSEFLDQL
jgi:hypothetical protein